MALTLNPLVREAARGLSRAPRPAYFTCLLIQAVVLFMWWPKSSLPEVLYSSDRPDTLLAVVVICAFTLGYYQIQSGAGEVLLPGQHDLGHWAAATSVPLARVLAGYLLGAAMEVLHALALSSPLWLIAFAVCDTSAGSLALLAALSAVFVLELRLGAAVIAMLTGRPGSVRFVAVRAWLVLAFVLPAVLIPPMNYLGVIHAVLDEGAGGPAGHGPALPAFVAAHGVVIPCLVWALHALLARRRAAPGAPEAGGRAVSP